MESISHFPFPRSTTMSHTVLDSTVLLRIPRRRFDCQVYRRYPYWLSAVADYSPPGFQVVPEACFVRTTPFQNFSDMTITGLDARTSSSAMTDVPSSVLRKALVGVPGTNGPIVWHSSITYIISLNRANLSHWTDPSGRLSSGRTVWRRLIRPRIAVLFPISSDHSSKR